MIEYKHLFIKLLKGIFNEIGLKFETNDEFWISIRTPEKPKQSLGSYI